MKNDENSTGLICFYCQKEILKTELQYFLPLDRPYINIPFHRETCLPNILGKEREYLEENKERLFGKNENTNKGKKRKGSFHT
jgi:hypothetical protein